MKRDTIPAGLCGGAAGAINGLLGAGGGMVLLPALRRWGKVPEESLFPTAVAVMLPLSLVSLVVYGLRGALPFAESLPYLLGSAAGGFLSGRFGSRIPTRWLHLGLGVLLLWGGIRSFF